MSGYLSLSPLFFAGSGIYYSQVFVRRKSVQSACAVVAKIRIIYVDKTKWEYANITPVLRLSVKGR